MKQRTMKKLLTVVLAAAMLVTAVPVNMTPARAAEKTPGTAATLDELGIIDAEGEEDTGSDLTAGSGSAQAAPYVASNGDMVIAIDPGHGGSDKGASYGGIDEKDVNLKIAKYLKTYLEDYVGVQVYLTRSTDTYVSLTDRVSSASTNGADVFVSIHNNSSTNTDTSGSMVFYPNESYRPDLSQEGGKLASSIMSRLTALGLPDLGTRIRDSESGNTYDDDSIADYYSVIRNAKISGISGVIVEHAFVSCESDRETWLSTDAALKKLAKADAEGIAACYDLKTNMLTAPAVTLTAGNEKKLTVSWDRQADARGYIVYRADKKNGDYVRLAKVSGSSSTSYTDATVRQGQSYYYKVRAYGKGSTSYYYSEYSSIVKGHTIGGTQLLKIKQVSGGYFYLRWTPYEDADGYALYRSEEGGAYKRIATISNPAQGDYRDRTVERGKNYSYKIRTIHNLYGNEGFGKCSGTLTATLLNDPAMVRLDIRDDGYIKVVWKKALGASKYVVQRSTAENGTYTTVATITDDTKNYYLDKQAEFGATYYYKVNAYNQNSDVTGSTGYVESIGVKNMQTPQLLSTRITTSRPGMYVKWTAVAGAKGYRIYRSTKKNSGYAKVATVKNVSQLDYIDESESTAGTTYYYKVKAYTYNSAGTAWSDASNVKSAVAGYSIMGKSNTTAKKMAAFFLARGGEYPEDIYSEYGAPTLEDFCEIVYDEAEAEGVRAEVVFGQICKETGFLRFGGDVEPEQCNFAGIGATGGGAQGAFFPDVTTGIRAQVQHLKAYASDEPLNQECVDPRFTYVKRGSALYVEWLGVHENPTGAGWATGVNYGYSLRDDYIRPLLEY